MEFSVCFRYHPHELKRFRLLKDWENFMFLVQYFKIDFKFFLIAHTFKHRVFFAFQKAKYDWIIKIFFWWPLQGRRFSKSRLFLPKLSGTWFLSKIVLVLEKKSSTKTSERDRWRAAYLYWTSLLADILWKVDFW